MIMLIYYFIAQKYKNLYKTTTFVVFFQNNSKDNYNQHHSTSIHVDVLSR